MAGIGGWLTTLLGSENKSKAAGRNVNSDNYQYGGSPGEAERQAEADRNAGIAAQRRQGVTVNYGQADQDRAMALRDRAAAQQARQGQNQVAQTSLARALGQAGPSIAQQQADRQMQQAQAAQASMAGSARGAGALANAQRNAANNVANAGAQISGQAQIAAAQERRDDTALAGQQYGNMRGGDLAQQGQSLGMQAQSANQAQSQAGFNDAQRARNDQYQQGQNQLAQQTRLAQLAANQNYEAQQSSNALGAQGINAGVGGQNASMNQANGMSLLGGAQSLGGAAFSSFGGTPGQTPPAKAKGGPVEGRAPYLVGERGPELIIPANDGMVIPSGPTQEAIQRTPSLARFLSARACGGPVDGMARAEGGPVESGGEVPPNPTDAGYLPAGYAPPVSTWGGSPVDADVYRSEAISDQRARMAPYEQASANVAEQRKGLDATAARINETVSGIDERDRDAVWNADYKDRHNQQMTAAESEQATEARYRQDSDRKQAKAKKKPSLSSLLADGGKSAQMASAGVDTAYHGPGGGFAPPMLIPLQARAFGGPIMGGGAPSMLQPLSGPGSGAAPASFDVLTSSGGMDPMASLKAHSNFATQFQRNPGASPMGYSAREEGGPVKSGGEPPTIVVASGGSSAPMPNGFAGMRSEVVAPISKSPYEQAADASDASADKLDELSGIVDPVGTNLSLRALLSGASAINRGRALGERYVVPAMDREVKQDRPIGGLISRLLGSGR